MATTWTRENIGSATADQQRSMDWVYATQFFRNEDDAAAWKREKTASYLSLFSSYEWTMENRPTTAGPPPTPAFAMTVVGDITGWSELAQSRTERVCETKIYTPAPKPELGHGKVGRYVFTDMDTGEDWFMWLPGDTTLPGKLVHTISSDGIEGLFVKQRALQGSGAGVTTTVNGYYIKKG